MSKNYHQAINQLRQIHNAIYEHFLPSFVERTQTGASLDTSSFNHLNSICGITPAFIKFVNGLVDLNLIPGIPYDSKAFGLPVSYVDLDDIIPALVHGYNSQEMFFSYHGTNSADDARSIIFENYDPSYRGNTGQVYGAGEYSSPDPITASRYGSWIILNLVIHPSFFHKHNGNEIYIVTPNPDVNTHISYMLPIGVAYFDDNTQTLTRADNACPQTFNSKFGQAQGTTAMKYYPSPQKQQQLVGLRQHLLTTKISTLAKSNNVTAHWYVDNDTGGWNPFAADTNAIMEQRFAEYQMDRSKAGPSYFAPNVDGHVFTYNVNFKKMTQLNSRTRKLRDLIRLPYLYFHPISQSHSISQLNPITNLYVTLAMRAHNNNPTRNNRLVSFLGPNNMPFTFDCRTSQLCDKQTGIISCVIDTIDPRSNAIQVDVKQRGGNFTNAFYEYYDPSQGGWRACAPAVSTIIQNAMIGYINNQNPTTRYVTYHVLPHTAGRNQQQHEFVWKLDLETCEEIDLLASDPFQTKRAIRLSPNMNLSRLNKVVNVYVEDDYGGWDDVSERAVIDAVIALFYHPTRTTNSQIQSTYTITVPDGQRWTYKLMPLDTAHSRTRFKQINQRTGRERVVWMQLNF